MKIGNIIQNGFKILCERGTIPGYQYGLWTGTSGRVFKGEGRAGITGGLGADGRTDLY